MRLFSCKIAAIINHIAIIIITTTHGPSGNECFAARTTEGEYSSKNDGKRCNEYKWSKAHLTELHGAAHNNAIFRVTSSANSFASDLRKRIKPQRI